ncbi:MAG: SDR family oxidoreductase [Nannocystaceae bacterium]
MELVDLKIIVTGGARGMGAHFATCLAQAGAKVAVGDVDEEGLAALPKGIARRRLDVSDDADCDAFVAWAHEQLGGLNGLINNAGIIRDGLLVRRSRSTGEVQTLPTEQWRQVLSVNLDGPTFMTRAVGRTMLEQQTRPGIIVNISSISRHGNRGQSNYVAAKAALAANTVTWARELAPFGIRVGCIAPGMVETPMTKGMKQQARDALVAGIPVGRIGEPEDIWRAVRFVIECEYFCGKTIDVDGGGAMG